MINKVVQGKLPYPILHTAAWLTRGAASGA